MRKDAAAGEVGCERIENDEGQNHSQVDEKAALTEGFERLLGRDAALFSDRRKQRTHAPILGSRGGRKVARTGVGIHVSRGEFFREFKVLAQAVVGRASGRGRPLAVRVAAVAADTGGAREDKEQRDGPARVHVVVVGGRFPPHPRCQIMG